MLQFEVIAVRGAVRESVCIVAAYSRGQARYWAPRFARWHGVAYQRLSVRQVLKGSGLPA